MCCIMDEYSRKEIRKRLFGVKLLSVIYIVLLSVIYYFVNIYVKSNNFTNSEHMQSIILILITSFMGTHSKEYYISLVQMIYNHQIECIPNVANKIILKITTVVNFLTLILLSKFLVEILTGRSSKLTLIAILVIPTLLYAISLYYKFNNSDFE